MRQWRVYSFKHFGKEGVALMSPLQHLPLYHFLQNFNYVQYTHQTHVRSDQLSTSVDRYQMDVGFYLLWISVVVTSGYFYIFLC